jgi:hypothetical protein
MSEPHAAGPAAAYARGCLAAARYDRDWFREAVAKLEAAGERVVHPNSPPKTAGRGRCWTGATGATLATITGGHGDYEAAWRAGWTDVC